MMGVGVISLIWFSIIHYYLGAYSCSLDLFLNSLLLIYCFYLTKIGYSNLSPFLALTSAATSIFYNGYYFIGDIGVQYVLLSLTPLPALTIDQSKRKTMFLAMFYIPLLGALTLILDFDGVGVYQLSEFHRKFLLSMCYLQGSLLVFFQSYAFLFEMENRYNVYLQNRSKIESQTRLGDLGLMTAGIAHEINNPLAVINASAIVLLRKLDKGMTSEEDTRKELHRVLGQSDRIIKIIRGLKFVSRDGSQDPFKNEDINQVVKEAYELCNQKLLRYKVQSSFIPSPEACYADIRVVQIQQVILSLVSNAIDAIEEQEHKQVNITLKCDDPSTVKIIVEDNGPGIPEDIKEEVLKPFFTTKPVGKGTGLGLSVAHEIMQKHGGKIEIDCTDGGTKFILSLPRVQSSQNVA